MLGPELLRPDDPWRPRLVNALRTRPLWRVDADDSARRVTGEPAIAEAVEVLSACSIVMIQRRHQQLFGPVLGVRIGFDGARGVVSHAFALDESPLEPGGGWTSWFVRGVHAELFGLSWHERGLEDVVLPEALRPHLPTWSEIRAQV